MTLASETPFASTCTAGLPVDPHCGSYVVDVVRVHLWPTDDIDGTAAPTSVLVEVDTFAGYALGEEEAVREAIRFAEAFTPGSEDHLGFINWRPEDEGPAVEVVSRPTSHSGPRPGERALRTAGKVKAALELRDAIRNRPRGAALVLDCDGRVIGVDSESVAPYDGRAQGTDVDPGDGPAPAY